MIPEYLKYILPTMLTFTLAGIYSIVDGIFVGHAVGDAGLAGINVAYPLVCPILAVGTGLGMGGGVISSIARGEGNSARAARVIGVTLFMLFAASIPILVLYILFAEQLCAALGGQGETLVQAVYYLQVIAVGAPFQVLVTGCTPLIRNRGQVAYAMAVQLLAGVINVVLDYVFVMQWGRGTAGAAEATVVAQIVAFLFVLAFFARRSNCIPLRDLLPDASICAHIVKLGAAPFGLTLLPEVSTVVNNISLSYYGGEVALAAYAAIAYVAFFVQIIDPKRRRRQPAAHQRVPRRGQRRRRAAPAQHELRRGHRAWRGGAWPYVRHQRPHPAAVRRLRGGRAHHRLRAAGVLHLLHLLRLHAHHHVVLLRRRRRALLERPRRRGGGHRLRRACSSWAACFKSMASGLRPRSCRSSSPS